MRIAIDATTLLLPSAGVKNYLYYWLRSLIETAGRLADEVVTYPPSLKTPPVIDHRSPQNSFGAFLRLKLVQLSNPLGSPLLELLLSRADLFHCSQHSWRLPRGVATTATIFDFSCWTTPEYHTTDNIAATRRYGQRILRRCDGLIAISVHAKHDAMEILGIPEERIRVIYPGVAEAFFRATSEQAAAIRTKYALPPTYILFAGCIEPRKNVLGLIRAYRRLPEAIRREAPLVLAGPLGWKSEAVRQELGAGQFRYLGYVPEPDLPGLFRAASAFVYPSYYEGFGLPVAQAMAAGVPVITSNRSSLPEVAGDAALLVDPNSPDALAAAIEHVLNDAEVARAFVSLGRARAGLFRWPACAAASLDFFHEVFAG